jgi:ATP-dependent Clp protease protease subunit
MSYSPWIIETTPQGEQEYDIWARLLKDRIIFVGTPINEHVANLIIAQLLYLEADDAEKDVIMYLNCPGGSVRAGLAVYDAMQYVRCDVQTLCVGQVAATGALLLAGGARGKRFSLPNARLVLRQPSGGVGGTAADIEITAEEILRMRNEVIGILVQHTGKDEQTIHDDINRDFYLSAHDAIEYGLLDEIVETQDAHKAGDPG